MKITLILAAGALLAGAAQAQDTANSSSNAVSSPNGTSFRGFRLEAQAGLNRFQSQGEHDHSFGYGGAFGFDGQIGERIVIGPEVTYWRGRGENITSDAAGGVIAHKSFNELGAAIRAGYLVSPSLLVYAKGGYVSDEQRKSYSGVNGAGGYYNHVNTDGYQVGGGVEYSLTNRFYVNAEYKYSNYVDHTSRQRALLGAGVRFP